MTKSLTRLLSLFPLVQGLPCSIAEDFLNHMKSTYKGRSTNYGNVSIASETKEKRTRLKNRI